MEQAIDIKYMKGIVRRRKTSFVLIFFLVFLVISCVAFILPPIFISKSTILIENQLIPQEYVQTTITGFVEERLQMIKQQIMSQARLMEIINRFNLYTEMRDRYTTAEIVEKMRGDIKLNTISADVRDKRTRLSTSATIAFTLSYEGKRPDTVQKVANVLASLYLEENLKARERRASTTTEFLEQELNNLKKEINNYQTEISAFKTAHLGELPEHNTVNMQAINALERDLNAVDMQINALEERKFMIEGQMSQIYPLLGADKASGEEDTTSMDRLKTLRLELINIKARVSEKHPDVIRLKKEITELEDRVGKINDLEEKNARLREIDNRLAEVKGKFGPNHPDVKRLKKEAAVLTDEIEKKRSEYGNAVLEEKKQENPATVNMKNQLALTQLQINKHLEEKARINREILRYRQNIQNAPVVEKEYANLMQDLENARRKYNDMANKLMEARVAQGMEETQMGERFTIIEPAQLPERPYKPNRMAILIIGFVLATGAGGGIAALKEVLDTSVKTADQLYQMTGKPVLSVIPRIESAEERRSRRIKWVVLILAAVLAIALALFIFHYFIMPLDIFWIKVERRLIKMGFSTFFL